MDNKNNQPWNKFDTLEPDPEITPVYRAAMEGAWNKITKSYSKRLVVFADKE